jgi:hypothetical protein
MSFSMPRGSGYPSVRTTVLASKLHGWGPSASRSWGIGILALAGMALLVGAALVGVAAGAVLIVGGILSSLSRSPFRR